jgi:hypothetical protein
MRQELSHAVIRQSSENGLNKIRAYRFLSNEKELFAMYNCD